MVNAPRNLAQTAGYPGQWSEQIIGFPDGLIVGETPAVVTEDMVLAADQTLLAYTPVGFDADENLVEAEEGVIQAIGIVLYDIVVPAGVTPGVPVMRQACLNKDMLAWPVSYDTDAKKLAAFRGAPTPTSIVVRKAYRGSIVAQP